MHQPGHYLSTEDGASEETLVRQSLAGNQDAFAVLVHRYEARLLQYIRHCLWNVGDDDQVYDVLQFVLLQFYRSLPTLLAGHSLKPWLFRVAHNRCVDILRSNRRRQIFQFSELERDLDEDGFSLLGAIQDTRPLPEEVVEQHEIRRRFQQAIQTLPPHYRSIVLFRYIHEMSFTEIGQQMNMPATTAKTYFHRARPLLCAALKTFSSTL